MSRLTSIEVGLVLLGAMLVGAHADEVTNRGSLAETQERNIRARGVEQWAKDLDSGNCGEGLAVVYAMEVIGPSTQGVVPVLIKALRHPEPAVRGSAIHTLASFGQAGKIAVPAMREALRDRETSVRIVAATPLWTLTNDGTVIPVLIAALEDTDPDNRGLAVEALGEIGPPAQAAFPGLVQRLDDKLVPTRVSVVEAIPRIGGDPSQLLPPLLRACNDSHFYVRRAAAQSLCKLGPNANRAIPTLFRLLNDLHGTVRVAAAEALWNIERRPAAVDRIAAELLTDEQTPPRAVVQDPLQYNDDAQTDLPAEVHQAAVNALARIGPSAPQAISVLREIKKQSLRSVHIRAALALEKLAPNEDSLPTVTAALTSSKFSVRIVAANALVVMGPRAKAATPALLQAMHLCAAEASEIPKASASDALETIRSNFEMNGRDSHCKAWLDMLSALSGD